MESWNRVDQFHAAAWAHPGTSEVSPSLHPRYDPMLYAAYVRDPDVNEVAAICRRLGSGANRLALVFPIKVDRLCPASLNGAVHRRDLSR